MNNSLVQVLRLRDSPFRENVLDYSFLSFSDIIDAFASSLLILSLSASILHGVSIIFGMSLRTLQIRTLLGKFPVPLWVFGSVARSKGSGEDRKLNSGFGLRVFAACTLAIILLAEGIVIFLTTATTKYVSLDDLKIRRIIFQPTNEILEGELGLSDWTSLVVSEESIAIQDIKFGIPKIILQPIPMNEDDIHVFLAWNGPENLLSFYVGTSSKSEFRVVISVIDSIKLSDSIIYQNVSLFVDNHQDYLRWVSDLLSLRFNCSEDIFIAEKEVAAHLNSPFLITESRVRNCTNGSDQVRLNYVSAIIESSVQLSNKTFSREDFVFGTEDGPDASVRSMARVFAADCMKSFGYSEVWNFSIIRDPTISARQYGDYDNEPASEILDWDSFGQFRTSRCRGYIIWVIGMILLLLNLILGAIAPDLQLSRIVAATQNLKISSLPHHMTQHVKFQHLRHKNFQYLELDSV